MGSRSGRPTHATCRIRIMVIITAFQAEDIGSIPICGSNALISQLVDGNSYKIVVVGSSPTESTNEEVEQVWFIASD